MVFELYQEKGLEVEMVQVVVMAKVLVMVTDLVQEMVRVKVMELARDSV
jgi:hypothetical protein